MNYLFDQLLKGRRVLVSLYINPKLILVKNVIEKAVNTGRVVLIVDPKALLSKFQLIDTTRREVSYVEKLELSGDISLFNNVFIIEPNYFPKLVGAVNVLVTTSPRFSVKRLRGFTKVYLKKIHGSTYLIELTDTMERFRLRITGGFVEALENKPTGVLGRIYDVLRNGLMEYGELRVKDAVNLLKHELGLTKQQAYMYLRKLASEKFIEVKKGYISVY